MPHKIPFEIEAFSGEDDAFAAKELNSHGPLVKGWQSPRFCLYPQDLILALKQRSRIQKIQILSHQFLIATKIEFFVGDVSRSAQSPQSLLNANFTRLGYVTLSDNSTTQFQARELKSVHVDAAGAYVKLAIHKNYVNQQNLYNQVGIIAVNVIGDPAAEDATDSVVGVTRHPSESEQKNNVVSPLDDLAFDMYQDPDVAKIIRRLNQKKQDAVAVEKFDVAKQMKEVIQALQKAGIKLGRYEIEKRQAIEDEDYDRAKLKKDQMEEYRQSAFKRLNLNQLLSMNLQDGATSRPPYEPESVATPSKLGAEVVTVLPPIGTPPPGPAAPHDADERPLPTVSKQISETKSSDSSTPDPKPSPSTLAPPGDPLEDAPVDVPTQPEPLAERDVQEMLVVLDIFEETLVAKVCSRSWQLREKGLQEMLEFLRTSYGPACVSREQGRNATRAMVLVLKRLFKDKVQVVFIATWELLQFLITEYIPSHKLAKSEVAYLVERSLPVLMGRIGERTNQSHRGYSPQQIVTSLAQIPDVKSLHIIQNNLQQPIKFSVAPKIAQARMEVLEELVKQFGVGESTGFVLQEVVLVAKGVVEHPSSPVRDVSYRLIVDLYREYGKPVKGCLPGDDDRIRKILTWRRIFEQFDRIDGKPTKAELAARAVDAEKQKMQQIQELQSQLENLRNLAQTDEPTTTIAAVAEEGEEELQEEAAIPQNLCVFCGEQNEAFGKDQGLDLHYWDSCPLLMRCTFCKQVVEISGLWDHLTDDCETKQSAYKKCDTCKCAISNEEMDKHLQDATCIPVEEDQMQCPLCQKIVSTGEKDVASHFMGLEGGCDKNPRIVVK